MSRRKWVPKPGSDETDVKTNVDFVRYVENTLGVLPDRKGGQLPWWRARSNEAGKLKRKRATDPQLYSMRNLLLTAEYLRRRQIEVKSATAVCWHIEEALEHANQPVTPSEVSALIEQAIDREHMEQRPGWTDWVGRLVRARGQVRTEVYTEWQTARGGPS